MVGVIITQCVKGVVACSTECQICKALQRVLLSTTIRREGVSWWWCETEGGNQCQYSWLK